MHMLMKAFYFVGDSDLLGVMSGTSQSFST
jgi:hypothetical protein